MATLLYIQAFCRSVIVLVFAMSFLGKVRHISTFQETIHHFALLPQQLDRQAAYIFLIAEGAVVILVALGGPLLGPGFLLATLLLFLFCLAMVSVLLRHISTSCSCFGASDRSITSTDVVRNTGFIACTLVGWSTLFWSGASNLTVPGLIAWGLIALAALIFVALWTQLGEIVQLFQ